MGPETLSTYPESVIGEVTDDKFRSLIEQDLVGTYIIQDNRFVYVNQRFANLFQYSKTKICEQIPPLELTAPEDRDVVRKNLTRRLRGEEKSIHQTFTALKKDGTRFEAETHGSRATYNEKPAIVGVIVDQNYSSMAEQAIQYLAMELSAQTPDELFRELTRYLAQTLDVDFVQIGEYQEHSERVEGMLYHHGQFDENVEYELAGTPFENIITQEQNTYPRNVQQQFPEDELLRKWDVEFYSGIPLRNAEDQVIGLLSVLHGSPYHEIEICERLLKIFAHRAENELERHKKNRTIKRLAFRDNLTDLPNRTSFYRDLEEKIDPDNGSVEKLALLFIDLDGFKQINDIFGHRLGDSVLEQVSSRLRNLTADWNDQTLYRWGGDEFIYVLSNIKHPKTPEQLSQKILESLEDTIEVQGKEFHLSGSIGISIYPDHAMDIDSLISRADIAMFKAKEKSGNTYQVYIEGTAETQEKRVTLEKDLQDALEDNEFILHYQPQFDIQTGELTGLEALIRWDSPELGEILPGSFIPLAEATRLIDPIGKWVMEQSAKTLHEWYQRHDTEIRLGINIAPQQFRSTEILTTIRQLLDRYEFPAHGLEIEITETTLMSNMEQTVELLEEFREMGVRVALDDFGTGYSSLLYLSQFPLDTLKIDRTFTEIITRGSSQAEVVEILRAVASELELNVIAEGIETEEQLRSMKEIGCNEAQGFLLGRPKNAEEITDWVEGNPTIRNLSQSK